jgi:hypothetical protein
MSYSFVTLSLPIASISMALSTVIKIWQRLRGFSPGRLKSDMAYNEKQEGSMSLLLICFVVFLLIGMPIAFVIGLAGIAFFGVRLLPKITTTHNFGVML